MRTLLSEKFVTKELRFIFSFLIFSSSLYFISSHFYSENIPVIGTLNVATILDMLLDFFGINSIQIGNILYLPDHIILRIIVQCTGLYEMIILDAMIMSYPTNIWNKLYGIIVGTSLVIYLNIIRLVTISYVLIYYNDKFNFIDQYLWQMSLVVFILTIYIAWLRLIE